MPGRNKYDGPPRPTNRERVNSLSATGFASAFRVRSSWGSTGKASGTRSYYINKALALLIVALPTMDAFQEVALASEPAASAEQSALAIDSASGLLAARQPHNFLGARSCAASACHGGIDPDPRFPLSRRNEYVTWLDKDPHSRSYQTLNNELSNAILDRLSRPTDDDATRANRLANCFGCHNPQPEPSRRGETYFTRDSVSCEICHGPAEQWIGPHVTASWSQLKGSGEAVRLGFVKTLEIATRAETCAACHVGSPGREVNHDLIAAGHPALKFELTAYYAMLPKHWRDEDERKANPQLELALWQAGQLACGEAAVELLKWRADRAAGENVDAIWPEFAEYDCYACHHDLVHPSWRQASATSSAPLGMPAWGSWYFSRLSESSSESLHSLADAMQRSFRPDPKLVLDAAKSVRLTAPSINGAIGDPTSWDDATQQYLALVATEQSLTDAGIAGPTEVKSTITRLREQLAFPAGHDSPKRLFESGNANVTRAQVHQSLLELMQQLQQRRGN